MTVCVDSKSLSCPAKKIHVWRGENSVHAADGHPYPYPSACLSPSEFAECGYPCASPARDNFFHCTGLELDQSSMDISHVPFK